MTQTISMPLKTLADPAMYSRVRVVISGIGIEESNYFNNEFTLNLSTMNRQPLSLIRQPADAVVQKGEDAVFTVEAAGGSIPYTYRWEVWMGESLGWRKIEGSDDPTLTVKNTTKAMDGWKYRCVVTDAAGAAVTSRAAGLTVTGVPGTGDSSNPVLYLTLAAAALALLWILRKKKPSRA